MHDTGHDWNRSWGFTGVYPDSTGISQFSTGISQFSTGISQFSTGISQYSTGISYLTGVKPSAVRMQCVIFQEGGCIYLCFGQAGPLAGKPVAPVRVQLQCASSTPRQMHTEYMWRIDIYGRWQRRGSAHRLKLPARGVSHVRHCEWVHLSRGKHVARTPPL
jgi:hypothetical protein